MFFEASQTEPFHFPTGIWNIPPANFPLEQPKKPCSIYFLTGLIFRKLLVNGEQPLTRNPNSKS